MEFHVNRAPQGAQDVHQLPNAQDNVLMVGSNEKDQQLAKNAILNVPLAMKILVLHAQLDYSTDVVSALQNANQDVVSAVNHQEASNSLK